MSNVSASAPVDPDSVDLNNSAAWEQAQAEARNAGILWERPDGDTRSAQEILDDNPLLKNLGNQSGVRESLEARVGGKIGKDADATYRAAQVLKHIERFERDGTLAVGNDAGNGRVDGFTSQGHARENTEAGRLQDFGKYGFSVLEKGQLQNIEAAARDPKAREKAEALGIEWERPSDDKRSAQDIIDDNPLLKNLGNQSNVKTMLKERVGDFENDADAAYRAAQVLEHIETFSTDGKRIAGKDVGNGKIDGFTSKGHARENTEAGRLQDFGKYGFDHLDGKLRDPKKAGSDKDAKAQAEALGIDWERPEGDTRTAKEIINSDPLLKNLGNQSGVKDRLKEQVGDFENDADAAYRATQVLAHIESFDGSGHSISGKSVGNGSIDGFTKSGEAKNGTEAGRLQDFGKHGFEALKGEMDGKITSAVESDVEKDRIDAVNDAREKAGLPPSMKPTSPV